VQRILTLALAAALVAAAPNPTPQFAPRSCAAGSTQCGDACIALGKVCYVGPQNLIAPPRCTAQTKVCGLTCIAKASVCHRRRR
jgi:hypothetical protein